MEEELPAEEDEVWAQTMFTITPQESGTLREIEEETVISGNPNVKLNLDTNNIVLVQKIESTAKHFIDPAELSQMPFSHVECQTYIQDIEKVHIPIQLIDEASQTFYIGRQLPIENVIKDVIVAISKKSIPILKCGQLTQTVITFNEDDPQEQVIEKLFENIIHDEGNSENAANSAEKDISQIEAWHCLNNTIERVFWISDPEEPIKETAEAETLTTIVFNFRTGKAIANQETQTSLTCEPKNSNSELLSDYNELKNLIKNCLEDCLSNGVYKRIIIDDILDEILDKCSLEIRLPFLDNEAQTLASYKALEGADEDILKKLRRPVAVDPEESKEVIALLTKDIIEATFVQISKDAKAAAKYVLCFLIKSSIDTAIQLQEIRKQNEQKPLDQVFVQRKKKLAETMRKKPDTETVSTQTKLAGVPEVNKLQELVETSILCSVCAAESECPFCSGSQGEIQEQPEILKTQDILLTYKPCYIRSTPPKRKISNLQIASPQKVKKISKICLSSRTSSVDSSNEISLKEEPVKRVICRKHSKTGPFFEKCSSNSSSKSTSKISSISENKSKSVSSKSQSNLAPQAALALKILKNAFCTRETCAEYVENSEIGSVTFSDEDNENRRKNKSQRIKRMSKII